MKVEDFEVRKAKRQSAKKGGDYTHFICAKVKSLERGATCGRNQSIDETVDILIGSSRGRDILKIPPINQLKNGRNSTIGNRFKIG